MNTLKIIFRLSVITMIMVFAISSMTLTTAFADKSPAGCTGSGLAINLYASSPQVHIGDVISFSVDIFNGVGGEPVVCDASSIQASIITPDGQTHSIPLVRTSLSYEQVDHYPNIVTYIARAVDVKPDGTLTATASDTGIIHQNDTNSQGGGNQGVNITVLAPPVVSPSTSSSPNPIVSPASTGTPTPTSKPSTTPIVPQVTSPSNPIVYPTPTYTGTPTPAGKPSTTPVIPPVTGGGGYYSSGGSGGTTVIVPATIATTTATILPSLPKTGFPPEDKGIPWNTLILISIFIISISASLILFLEKDAV